MLSTIDAHKYPEMQDEFLRKIANTDMCFLIENGAEHKPYAIKRLDHTTAQQLLSRLKSQAVLRMGCSRSGVMPPYFSGTMDQDGVLLTDLIIYPPSEGSEDFASRIKESISLAVLDLLLRKVGFPWVRIPTQLAPWDFYTVKIEQAPSGLVFYDDK